MIQREANRKETYRTQTHVANKRQRTRLKKTDVQETKTQNKNLNKVNFTTWLKVRWRFEIEWNNANKTLLNLKKCLVLCEQL